VGCLNQFRWTSAACTDVGRVREINEDSCLDRPQAGLWAVADGMGGHSLGDFASRLVITSLDRLIAPSPPEHIGSFINSARRCLQDVNRELREAAALRDIPIIGSTAVVLVACERSCGYLWAGDSRLYLYRNGRLSCLTRDHNLVEELRARGELPPEDSDAFPARNQITRAVGAADFLDVDEHSLAVEDRDVFLLCSDGLSNELSDDEIAGVLAVGDCRRAAESLVDLALRHGGRDNVSAVVARADDLDSGERTMLNPAV
jgi:protein phosphatase